MKNIFVRNVNSHCFMYFTYICIYSAALSLILIQSTELQRNEKRKEEIQMQCQCTLGGRTYIFHIIQIITYALNLTPLQPYSFSNIVQLYFYSFIMSAEMHISFI